MRLVKRIFSSPCPLWLALFLAFATTAGAVTPVLVSSLKVPTGGTITDTNATPSTCVGANGSKQFTYGSNCMTSVSVTGPIQNTGSGFAPIIACATCLTTAGGQSVNGFLTFPPSGTATSGANFPSIGELIFQNSTWNGTAAQTNQYLLALDNAGNLNFDYAGVPQVSFSNAGVLTDNGQIVTGGGSTSGCGSTVIGTCYGSGNGATNIIDVNIGKQSGGYGGATTSNSNEECFTYNNGTTDKSACTLVSSGGLYEVGLGSGVVVKLEGANNSSNGTFQSSDGGVLGYVPPVYTSAGVATAATMHGVVDTVSVTVNSCVNGAACTFSANGTVTLTSPASFTNNTSYACWADGVNVNNEHWTVTPQSASVIGFQLLNETGATISGAISITYACLGK